MNGRGLDLSTLAYPGTFISCSYLPDEGQMALPGISPLSSNSGLPQLGEEWGTWKTENGLYLSIAYMNPYVYSNIYIILLFS